SWKQSRMKEVVDVYDGTHQTPRYTKSGVMFLSVENIHSLKSNKYISYEDFERNFKVFPETGDVLMTRIGDIGTANVVESDKDKAYYVTLALLKKRDLDAYFLKENIQSGSIRKELWHRTLHIAFPKKINMDEIGKVLINYPEIREQQKIGEFFKVLDGRIANQERKIAKVNALKSAYLTEMFPQEGETVPKRRFKGFEGEWVVKQLSEIVYKAVDNRGKTPPLNIKGKYPIIEVISLGGRKPNYANVEKYIDEFTYSNFLRDYVEENDILFSTVGRIGVVSMMDSHQYATIAQNIVGFRAKESYEPNFLYALFSNKLNFKRVNKIVMGAVQPSVKVSELVKVNYLVSSSYEEQQKIGNFFKNLDNQIEMEEKKLDKLQKMKE